MKFGFHIVFSDKIFQMFPLFICVEILSSQATQKYSEIWLLCCLSLFPCDLTVWTVSVEFGDFKSRSSWWVLTPVISALKRVREKDHIEFKASPNYEDPSKRREPISGSRDGVLEEWCIWCEQGTGVVRWRRPVRKRLGTFQVLKYGWQSWIKAGRGVRLRVYRWG